MKNSRTGVRFDDIPGHPADSGIPSQDYVRSVSADRGRKLLWRGWRVERIGICPSLKLLNIGPPVTIRVGVRIHAKMSKVLKLPPIRQATVIAIQRQIA